MNESITFTPPQRNGIIFHISVMVALLAASLLFFNLATQTDLGPAFLAYLLAALFLAVPLPLLGYRLFSLCSAEYIVDRDGLHLRWGQRGEDIPIGDILWVRSGEELAQPLEQPTLRWPGSIVGRLAHEEAGTLEFMAAQIDEIVLIGVDQKVYVISPQDCAGFIQAYESLRELGSLAPFAAHSTYPNFVVSEVWESTPARSMLVVGFVLGLALWIWVGVTVPSRESISLGFAPNGLPLPPVSSAQLFLLPVINLGFYLGNFVLALFFYRKSNQHPLAFILWGSSVAAAALLLAAVYFILSAG